MFILYRGDKMEKKNNLLEIANNISNIKEDYVIGISEKKKISLEERFKSYKGNNLTKDFSWDESIGKELFN